MKQSRAAKRTDLLAHGIFQRSQWETNEKDSIPSELIQMIHNFCYPLFSDWVHRHITLQMVTPTTDGDRYLCGCTLQCWHNGNDTHLDSDTLTQITDPYSIGFCSDPKAICRHKSTVWRMYRVNGNVDGFIIRPVDTNIAENEWICKKTPYLGKDGLDSKSNARLLQLVMIDGCGTDEYHIQCIDDGQYLSVDDEDNTIHFQGDQTKSVRVRLKLYSRSNLDQWRQDLDEGSRVWYRDDENAPWRAGIVQSTRKRKRFEKEISIQLGLKGTKHHYVPIRSAHICDAECKDADHGHGYWWTDFYPNVGWDEFYDDLFEEIYYFKQFHFNLGLSWTREGVHHNPRMDQRVALSDQHAVDRRDDRYSRRLKSREKQKVKRRKQREYRRWNGRDDDKRIGRKMRKYGVNQMY